ncbi:hypothetical protein K7432_009107 [Basidiobolus ranarum]|uniref:Uncharacterized protein n=1 Tax=Basidiobolus ranarum TaxID=34480 RepID=A0ABR2WQS0_9FUNG
MPSTNMTESEFTPEKYPGLIETDETGKKYVIYGEGKIPIFRTVDECITGTPGFSECDQGGPYLKNALEEEKKRREL